MPKPPIFKHEDQVKIDFKDPGVSKTEDSTVVAGEPPFDDPNEYSLDSNWSVSTYAGNDTINLRAIQGGVENSVNSGDGNDKVYDSPHNDTVKLGAGDDYAEMTTGMGYVDGGKGSDTIRVYIEQFMDPNYEPPSDPGGPFWLRVLGGTDRDGSDVDTLQLYMSNDRIENTQYDEVISQAFEEFKAGTIDSAFLMPQGELHLGEYTAAHGLERVDILVGNDIETLQIINQDTGQIVYPIPTEIA